MITTFNGEQVEVQYKSGMRLKHFREKNNLLSEGVEQYSEELFRKCEKEYAQANMPEIKDVVRLVEKVKYSQRNGFQVVPVATFAAKAVEAKHAADVREYLQRAKHKSENIQNAGKLILSQLVPLNGNVAEVVRS